MPKYTCSKCALTAYSKNARTRSIFTDDQKSALYSHLINIKTSKKENGLRQITLTFPHLEGVDDDPKRSDEELEMDAFKLIQEIESETLPHLICSHKWEIVPNTGDEL